MSRKAMNHPAAPPSSVAIEAIEFPLLLEAVWRRYGYDFRDYAPASLKRRVRHAMMAQGLPTLSALQDAVLHDERAMAAFLDDLTVEVTAMFRDPSFHKAFRDKVVPLLRPLPLIRVWHAACASGEEVYSMAILLHEAGLLGKTRLYATDMNERALDAGRAAIYPLRHMQSHTANYQRAGGTASFSDYYSATHNGAILHEFLRGNIVWAAHNLVSDASFNEFDVILCRNVMIYFNAELTARVHRLLYASLAVGGVLGLGRAESLQYTPHADYYEALDATERLYRKIR